LSAIEKIQAKLAKYPTVHSALEVDGAARTVTVLPIGPTGFAVSLAEHPKGWTVSYEGWHEEFDSEEEALDCFAFGLSAACRLRVEYRGTTPVKWSLEVRSGGGWVEESTVGLLHPFFWRPRAIRHLQNEILPADPRSEDYAPAT